MKLDLDIIFALLRSLSAGDDASLLAQFNLARINTQRELLLENGFIAGDAWTEDRRPLDWNYSKTFLTESGQHLLQLSTDHNYLGPRQRSIRRDGAIVVFGRPFRLFRGSIA
jgi:hypothetical protein